MENSDWLSIVVTLSEFIERAAFWVASLRARHRDFEIERLGAVPSCGDLIGTAATSFTVTPLRGDDPDVLGARTMAAVHDEALHATRSDRDAAGRGSSACGTTVESLLLQRPLSHLAQGFRGRCVNGGSLPRAVTHVRRLTADRIAC
jgi:hypothetical protein